MQLFKSLAFMNHNKIHPLLLFVVIVFSILSGSAQELQLKSYLPQEIKESSGLVFLDDKLVTHQDSGNPSELFEIDSSTFQITRRVALDITNKDWEEITADEEFIYIGDFGNNRGNRKDLTIYKIPKGEYLEANRESFSAETITFAFADQANFKSSNFSTAYDTEAFVSLGDKLYIFTKDWTNFVTHVYKVSKQPGDYIIEKITTININGLVTGATVNPETRSVVLAGYGEDGAFVALISNFQESDFQQYNLMRYDLSIPQGASSQVEGIAHISGNTFMLTSETGVFGKGAFYSLELPQH